MSNRTETADRMEAQYLEAAAHAAATGTHLPQRTAMRNGAYWWAREQGTPQPAAETFADWVMSEAIDGRRCGDPARHRAGRPPLLHPMGRGIDREHPGRGRVH